MKRRSFLSLTSAAAALALGLSACTGGTPGGTTAPTNDAEANSIRYLVEQPEDPADLEALRTHLKTYEQANPGTTVSLEAMPSENMRTVLQTQLRSGEGPDVFSWGSGPGYAGALAQAGLLFDLTPAYEQYKWPVYDFAKQRVTFDGKIVGIPGEMETIGLFYNKDMFAEMGLEQPTSVGELTAAAQKIKDAGKTPIAAADQEGWPGGHMLSMALGSRIGSQGVDALIDGQGSWNSPDVVAAVQQWKDWNDAGLLGKSPTAQTTDGAAALFYSGDAAILPTGSWAIPAIDKNAKFDVGYMPFPSESGAGVFTGGLGSGPFISASSKKTDAAVKFLNFLVSPEHGRWTVEEQGTIPAYPVDTTGVQASPLFAQVLKDTSTFSQGTGDVAPNIDVLQTDRFNDVMWDSMQGVLSGQRSPQEVAVALDKVAKK
jgi:raffinose/stachyose/melibiose transport system substrate-binding protein